MPEGVQADFGYALYVAQQSDKHRNAKPLKGFGGGGVVEVVSDHRGDTFRCVYTVRLARSVYVLHAFQKKSQRGRTTPKGEMSWSGSGYVKQGALQRDSGHDEENWTRSWQRQRLRRYRAAQCR